MKVLSNLEFKNSTYILNKFNDFPENPSEGMTIFKENGLYIYSINISSGNLEWLNILDFTRVNSSFKFEQTTENIEWNITHNLNTQDLFVIVYDSDGNKQIESEIQFQSDNEIKLIFSEPISGKALLFGASVVSSPSNMYTKEEIDELLKNISGGSGNIILPENGTDGQVLIKDSNTESGLNWSDKIDGKSAYDIAKDSGFEGSEEEWLKSLKGTNGGFSNSIDYSSKLQQTVTETTTSDGYRVLEIITENSGLALVSCAISSGCNYIQYLVNDSPVVQLYPSSSATNSFPIFVTKDDKVEARINKSYTFNSKGCVIYPYKEQNTYSTDEIIIGTWIDGKPIYRKVYTDLKVPAASSWQPIINIADLNVETVKTISGHFIVSGYRMNLESGGQLAYKDNEIVIYQSSSNYFDSPLTLILEYTKI